MSFRVSIFLSQRVGARTAGWTMNFWNSLTDQSAVVTATRALALAVYNFTGAGVGVTGARVQDLNAFRAALPIDYPDLVPLDPQGNYGADYPTTKGLLRLYGPQKYLANMWIGTLADRATTTGGVYTPPPVIVSYFNALKALLTTATNGWSLYSQDKGQPKTDVTAISAAGVVTSPGHGLLTGDHTRISRVKGITSPLINKIWLVTKIDNDTFQLVPAPVVVGAMSAPGKSQKQLRIMQAITDAVIVRTTEHKVGRPFGLFSGRRKRRAI